MTVDSSGLSYFRYWVHIEMRYCNIRIVYKWWMWTMHFPSLRPDALESKTRIQSLLLFIFRSNISSSLDRQLFGASGRDPSRWRRVSSFRLHLLLFSSSFLHRYWRRTKTNLLLWTFCPFWLCKREQNSCHGDCIPPPPAQVIDLYHSRCYGYQLITEKWLAISQLTTQYPSHFVLLFRFSWPWFSFFLGCFFLFLSNGMVSNPNR